MYCFLNTAILKIDIFLSRSLNEKSSFPNPLHHYRGRKSEPKNGCCVSSLPPLLFHPLRPLALCVHAYTADTLSQASDTYANPSRGCRKGDESLPSSRAATPTEKGNSPRVNTRNHGDRTGVLVVSTYVPDISPSCDKRFDARQRRGREKGRTAALKLLKAHIRLTFLGEYNSRSSGIFFSKFIDSLQRVIRCNHVSFSVVCISLKLILYDYNFTTILFVKL